MNMLWNNLITLLAISILATLFSCGGTSETGNARLASISGSILVNDCDTTTVWVHLVNERYFPGNDTSSMVFKTAVDFNGNYSLQSIPWNNYYLYIKGNDQNVLRGPLTITVPEVELGKDTLRYTSVVSVYTPDTALYNFIFIRGIPEVFKVSAGYTTLSNVPSGLIEIISGNSTVNYSDPFDTSLLRTKRIAISQFDTISIGFNNSAPVFDTTKELSKVITFDSLRMYHDTLLAWDPDSDRITYHLSSAPAGMYCDSFSGVISWAVPYCLDSETVSVTGVAEDSRGSLRAITWVITITNYCIDSRSKPVAVFSEHQLHIMDTITATFNNCYCSDSSLSSIRISWGNGDTLTYPASTTVTYSRYIKSGIYFITGKLMCSKPQDNYWFNIDSMVVVDKKDSIMLYGEKQIIIEKGTPFVDPGAVVITHDSDTITQIITSGTVDHNTRGVYYLWYEYRTPFNDTLLSGRKVFVVSEDSTMTALGLRAIDTVWNNSNVSITFSRDSLLMVTAKPYVRFRYNQGSPSEWTESMTFSFPVTEDSMQHISYQYLNLDTFSYSGWIENYQFIKNGNIPMSGINILTSFDTLHINEQFTLAIQGARCSAGDTMFAHINWGDGTSDNNHSFHMFRHTWNTAGMYTISILLTCNSSSLPDSVSYTKVVRVFDRPLIDTVPPVISLIPATIFKAVGDTLNLYDDPGATAFDAQDGDLTNKITITENVNVNVPGTYYIIYSVSDSAGNQATAVREVVVQ